MKTKEDWLITTILAEDFVESRNAYSYFASKENFVRTLPSIYPVSNASGLSALADKYANLAKSLEILNNTLQPYGKKVPDDYAPVITAIAEGVIANTRRAVIELLDKDWDTTIKCNKKFGRNKKIFDKSAKSAVSAEEYKQISKCYDAVIVATRPLAKYLGDWLNVQQETGH